MFITKKNFEAAIAQAKKEAANEVYKRVDEENTWRSMNGRLEKLEGRVNKLEKGTNCACTCDDAVGMPTLPF